VDTLGTASPESNEATVTFQPEFLTVRLPAVYLRQPGD
jgi:hypothetical protein